MRFGVPWQSKSRKAEARQTADEDAQTAASSGPAAGPDSLGIQERIDGLADKIDGLSTSPAQEPAPELPPPPLPAELERALAEIAARQRTLYAEPAPFPAQGNFASLEAQLRNITRQLETLRTPGIENAIHALREELSGIGRTMKQA